MATHDKTGKGGTTGHPSTGGRRPYLVENTTSVVDYDPAAADIIQMTAGHHDPDAFVDAYDATGTGHAPMDATDAAAMLIVKTADTIDVLTAGAQDTAGKFRVWAVLCDISGVDEEDHN